MSSYTKLFSSIIHSSVWQLDPHVKIVWVTMLALKDIDGVVEASVPGLAAAAGVSMADTEQALALFMAPDPHSRTESDEGRRARKVPGGWYVINHDLYNDRSSAEHYRAKNAARQQRLRDSRAARVAEETTSNVTRSESSVTRNAESVTRNADPVTSNGSIGSSNTASRKITPLYSSPDPDPALLIKNKDSATASLAPASSSRELELKSEAAPAKRLSVQREDDAAVQAAVDALLSRYNRATRESLERVSLALAGQRTRGRMQLTVWRGHLQALAKHEPLTVRDACETYLQGGHTEKPFGYLMGILRSLSANDPTPIERAVARPDPDAPPQWVEPVYRDEEPSEETKALGAECLRLLAAGKHSRSRATATSDPEPSAHEMKAAVSR